jgi:predicted Zn-dependent peptidase
VVAVTPKALYEHYQRILRSSAVEIFYVGAAEPETVAQQLRPMFDIPDRSPVMPEPQTPFRDGGGEEFSQAMDVSQAKLCMGFVTPVTIRDPRFVAMQLLNLVYGGGMTNKLFMNIREKMSLCYAIGTGYHGAKGIMTLSAGIDTAQESVVRQEIAAQLEACCRGDITEEELRSAKESLRSSLQAIHDSPGAMENYYASAALSGLPLTAEEYMAAAEATTVEEVAEVAKTLKLHTVFFLKGVSA